MSELDRRKRIRVPTLWATLVLLASRLYSVGAPPALVAPGGAAGLPALTGDPCPRFSWETLGQADSYELVVYRIGDHVEDAEVVIVESLSGALSSWSPEGGSCLTRNGRYAWSLRAWMGGIATAWSEPAFFELVGLTSQSIALPSGKDRSLPDQAGAKEADSSDPEPVLEGVGAALEEAEEALRAKDYARALSLLEPLAEAGHPRAQNGLGMMYGHGLGVERDLPEAVTWHRRAAEQGYARGQYFLGLMYADGLGVAKDSQQAVVWLSKAADQGDADAAFSLGVMFAEGEGVERDRPQAVEWYRIAAELGHAEAQHNLAQMYSMGTGIEQDPEAFLRWQREAAERGDPVAQFTLGILYAMGRGVSLDYEEGYAWIQKAMAHGYPIFFRIQSGWTIGHYAESPNGDWILELLPEGDDIDDWDELVTIQKFDTWWGAATAEASFERLKAERELACPRATDWNVLGGDGSSIVYEWQTHSCRGWPDQHEVAKIIYGEDMRARIAYSAKAYRIPSSRQEDWVERIAEAAIGTARP